LRKGFRAARAWRGRGEFVGESARGERPGVVDTHAFAFSPIFLKENHLPEELDGTFATLVTDMDKAGVAHTIATAFVTKQDDTFETVMQGLERHPGRVSAQLYIAPNRAGWAAANVRAAAREGRVAGARAAPSLFKMHPVDEALEQVWDACEASGLPVQVVVDASKYSDPPSFAVLARQRPRLKLVLSFSTARRRADLARLSRYPGVYFQVPGLLDSEVASGTPAMLRWALRSIPHDRLMFGSDRLGRERSYFAKVKALLELPPQDREEVARATALRLYPGAAGGERRSKR
jgi:predicted TIM-barrel fold metal-dependent hydrolase